MNARVHITPQSTFTATVNVWGFDMACEYEYVPGEAPIMWPTDAAHPGSAPNATLYGCRINGVQVIEMLRPEQIERIEEALLEQAQVTA